MPKAKPQSDNTANRKPQKPSVKPVLPPRPASKGGPPKPSRKK